MRLNLNKILESRGMSLIELSKLSGLGRTTLSELNNTNTLPEKTKVETLIKLCSALKITMETLVETEKGSFKIKDKNYISEIKDFSADLLFQYDKEFFSQTFQLGIYAQKEIGSESKQKLYEERLRLEKNTQIY